MTNNPRPASEAAPAVFQISGASSGATRTATEGTGRPATQLRGILVSDTLNSRLQVLKRCARRE